MTVLRIHGVVEIVDGTVQVDQVSLPFLVEHYFAKDKQITLTLAEETLNIHPAETDWGEALGKWVGQKITWWMANRPIDRSTFTATAALRGAEILEKPEVAKVSEAPEPNQFQTPKKLSLSTSLGSGLVPRFGHSHPSLKRLEIPRGTTHIVMIGGERRRIVSSPTGGIVVQDLAGTHLVLHSGDTISFDGEAVQVVST